MAFSLNVFPQLTVLAASPASFTGFSQAELAERYPVVAAATLFALGVGLACDVYLLMRLRHRVQPSATGPSEPLLQVESKPWTTRDLGFITGVVILAFAVGNSLLALGLKVTHVEETPTAAWFLTLELLLSVGCLIGMTGFFRRHNIDWKQAVGLRPDSSLRALAVGGFLFLAVLPPLTAVSLLYGKLCHVAGVDDTPQSVVDLLITSDSGVVVGLIIAFAVAVAPVFEEFFFRGFAYPALKQRWGCWRALTAVSAVFALAHLHVPSIGPLFALALGLGLAYEFTGSLLTPIAMHALFNAANVVLLLYVRAHP
jgi:membrane protease YdiL (CAAX protease family)